MLKYLASALLCTVLAAPALAQGSSIKKLDPALDNVIAPGAKIEKVATGFIFIEGPMWKEGKLWFSDVRMDKVRTYDPKTGKVTVILNDAGGIKNAPPDKNFGSNGMITDKDGSILLTRMYIGAIERMDDKGNTKPFLSKYKGKRLNSPNDLVFTADGGSILRAAQDGRGPQEGAEIQRRVALCRRQACADGHRHDPAQRHRFLTRRQDALCLQLHARYVYPRL